MYGRALLLSALYSPDTFMAIPVMQVALTRNVPVSNTDVSQLIEPTGSNYVRQDYATGSDHWAPSGYGELYNALRITYPEVVSSWGFIAGWAIIDPVAAQVINAGGLLAPFDASAGVIPFLDPGTLMLGLRD